MYNVDSYVLDTFEWTTSVNAYGSLEKETFHEDLGEKRARNHYENVLCRFLRAVTDKCPFLVVILNFSEH